MGLAEQADSQVFLGVLRSTAGSVWNPERTAVWCKRHFALPGSLSLFWAGIQLVVVRWFCGRTPQLTTSSVSTVGCHRRGCDPPDLLVWKELLLVQGGRTKARKESAWLLGVKQQQQQNPGNFRIIARDLRPFTLLYF